MKSRIPFDTIYIETMEQKDMIVKNKNALKSQFIQLAIGKSFFSNKSYILIERI